MTRNLLRLFIYACFFPYGEDVGFTVSPPDVVGALLAIVVLGEASLSKARLPSPNLKIVALAFLAFLSVCISNVINLGGTVSLGPVVKYFVFLLVLPSIVCLLPDRQLVDNYRLPILKWTSQGSLLLASFLVICLATGNYTLDEEGNYYIAFYHKNEAGILLAMGAISSFALYLQNKSIFYVAIGALSILLTVIVGDRSALIAEFFAIILLSLIGGRRSIVIVFTGLLFLAVALALFALTSRTGGDIVQQKIANLTDLKSTSENQLTSASSRLLLWARALELFRENPIWGVGYGGFFYQGKGWLAGRVEPHNGVLQILCEGGLMGELSFALLLSPLVLGWKNIALADRALRILLLAYLGSGLAGIWWIKGDGHLFWLIFFSQSLGLPLASSPRNSAIRYPFGKSPEALNT